MTLIDIGKVLHYVNIELMLLILNCKYLLKKYYNVANIMFQTMSSLYT